MAKVFDRIPPDSVKDEPVMRAEKKKMARKSKRMRGRKHGRY